MSFILDALKKSEAERLRKDTPGFADVPGSTREKSATRWIWIVAVLIIVNIAVLAAIFMKSDRVRQPLATMTTAAPAAEAPAVEAPATGSLSELVEQTRPVTKAAAVATDPVTRAVIDTATRVAEPPPPVSRISTPQITESYATFNDLRAQGVLQLPDLNLDIHVYGAEPEDRFVFINMSKYKERATLDEGPVVKEITHDGVVLEYRGTEFLLPRE